jgi:hypothetical protein
VTPTTSPDESAPLFDPRDGALCLGCNYPLRGLREPRCPECGRAFDPDDPWTMNIGRPMPPVVRRLIAPPGRRSWIVFFVAIGAILWGSAWLAGGQFVLIVGIFLLALNVVYRGVRLAISSALAMRYRQPIPRRPGLFDNPLASTFILLGLGIVLYFEFPLKLTIACARPAVHRIWAVDPAPMGGGFRDHFVGPLWADWVDVNPNKVYVQLNWSGSLDFDPETGDVVIGRMPLQEGIWRIVHGRWND